MYISYNEAVIASVLNRCWASVVDGEPTSNQRWIDVSVCPIPVVAVRCIHAGLTVAWSPEAARLSLTR